jgi:ABC-type multidrug transport system ATPase subunit
MKNKPTLGYIGAVPQFDALFDDLTVEEHLNFFAQMYGYERSKRQALALCIAKKIGLDGD